MRAVFVLVSLLLALVAARARNVVTGSVRRDRLAVHAMHVPVGTRAVSLRATRAAVRGARMGECLKSWRPGLMFLRRSGAEPPQLLLRMHAVPTLQRQDMAAQFDEVTQLLLNDTEVRCDMLLLLLRWEFCGQHCIVQLLIARAARVAVRGRMGRNAAGKPEGRWDRGSARAERAVYAPIYCTGLPG